jgi:beta-lactamase regulating signal transducer with metallopeptidase domain
MSLVLEVIDRWAEAWLSLIWAIVWQSSILALGVGALCWLLRRSTPALRFWLWQLVAIKLLIMPLWTIPVVWPAQGSGVGSHNNRVAAFPRGFSTTNTIANLRQPSVSSQGRGTDATNASATVNSIIMPLSWKAWLMMAWAGVVLWQIARVWRQRAALSRIVKGASIEAPEPWPALVAGLSADIGLRQPPRIIIAELDGSPFVCGLRRPTLVLPGDLLEALDLARWRQVVLHELAHIKRGDLVWAWIPEIARIFYFFHPVALWAAARSRLERELACDGLAMRHSGFDASEYADTLFRVVTRTSTPTILRSASAALDGDQSLTAVGFPRCKESKR